jgi:Plant mobile domain
MDSYLHRLSLYQMVIMGDYQLDKSLLTALVDRWRTKTLMFHLLVGEMTVTLEDVCSLWRLTIKDILLFLYTILYIIFEVY